MYQRYSDEEILEVLIDVKVPEGMNSGYRTITMPTQYKHFEDRILCAGPYQLWWVQRTLYDFVIEFRSSFAVSSPPCDWDPDNKRYLPYKVITDPQREPSAVNAPPIPRGWDGSNTQAGKTIFKAGITSGKAEYGREENYDGGVVGGGTPTGVRRERMDALRL